jgi:outer membrane protein assembly factor BamB
MIRIRTGVSWRDDPRISAALRAAAPQARAQAARELSDALAIEVDGVDLAAGLAEAPLLPSLEELLGAIARVVSGAPHAAVVLGEGGLELVLRRRGSSAFLTVVALGRPSRLLARDVEVEIDALAGAALEAAAGFCHELAAAVPGASRDAQPLRAAVRHLSRVQPRPPAGAPPEPTVRNQAPEPGRLGCGIEIADHEGLLAAYEGGRPDLGSLLVPGSVVLHGPDGAALLSVPGHPFLALRDLTAAADRALCAVRRGDPRFEIALARPGRGVATLTLDLTRGATAVDGRAVACPPLVLLRAFAEAALDFCRLCRGRNPRQAENGHLTELESAATERVAELDELAGGDLPRAGAEPPSARARLPVRVDERPLGPGRLRRLSFRRLGGAEVGAPAGLALHGRRILAAGGSAVACLDRDTGATLWRARGSAPAALLPTTVLAWRAERLWALSPSTGRQRWERDLPGAPATGAALLSGGPAALVEPGAVTGLDPRSGATVWRFVAPGASRTWAVPFGPVLVAGSDTGFLHGLDAEGRLLWRVRAPGPLLRGPAAWGGTCLALCETASGSALLAVDAATGVRKFEAPLELVPVAAPVRWGTRLVVPGTVAGDPAITVLERGGELAWTSAPPLAGAPDAVAAGPLLVVRDAQGGLVALDRDGRPRWSRPAPEAAWRGPRPLALSRETLVVAGDGITCHALETGEIVGAIPGVSAAHLAVDAELVVSALDLDGQLTIHRLGTHLSVV